jgi:hypothetical protein
MNQPMRPLLVLAAPDGSSLVLGDRYTDGRLELVFQHESQGAPEVIHEAMAVFWVTIDGCEHVVFAGDGLDEPEVDRVELELPHETRTCRVLPSRKSGRLLWMSFPLPFGPFEPPPAETSVPPGAVVTATWFTKSGGVLHSERTAPLESGTRWPEPPPPLPPPEYPDWPSPLEHPTGWTGYSPLPDP